MTAYTKYNDGELLDFLRNDDQAAFTEIYNRYHKSVYAYVAGFVKDSTLAEDLVHEIFIKLWEIRDRLQVHASFSSYLFRICHNKAINAMQKIAVDNRLRRNVLDHLQTISTSYIQDATILQKYDQLLEDALDSLPPQRRKVFMLCRHEGKSYDEAAAELGISRNTVKEHMVLAMKALRAFLGDKGEIAFLLLFIVKMF